MAAAKIIKAIAIVDRVCYIKDRIMQPGERFEYEGPMPKGSAFHIEGTEPTPEGGIDKILDVQLAQAQHKALEAQQKDIDEKLKALGDIEAELKKTTADLDAREQVLKAKEEELAKKAK